MTAPNNSHGPYRRIPTWVLIAIIMAILVGGAVWTQYKKGRSNPTRPTTTTQQTTTTRPTTTITLLSDEGQLRLALDSADWAALSTLAIAYEGLERALDTTDRAAMLTFVAASGSGDQELINTAGEAVLATFDDVDHAALDVATAAAKRLDDALKEDRDWPAVNRYLSSTRLSPSDFDTVLDAWWGFPLNQTEVLALLAAR